MRPTVLIPDRAASERGLSNSRATCPRPRWPPLRSLASRGSVRDCLRSPATTRPSRGSVHTTVPFPDRAALARSLSYSTETRLRPPRTCLRHLAPRESLHDHSRRFTLPNPVHLNLFTIAFLGQLRTFWSPCGPPIARHTCVLHPADGVTTNIFDAPLWDIQ
ncbi:hypothetical protein EDB83DRAFT_438348 [Lactarius deliciosus]|nr:hypothetical protein EDB83DRAFT_438348 [Lactarius deliciosus]